MPANPHTITINETTLTRLINAACLRERMGRRFIRADIFDRCVFLTVETDRCGCNDVIMLDTVEACDVDSTP